MEAELEERRQKALSELIDRVKAPGDDGCGIKELQAILQELTGQEVSARQAELLLHKHGGGAQLPLRALEWRAFLEDACRLIATGRVEAAAAERAAREEEVVRRAAQRQAAERATLIATLPPPNQDTSWWVRVCAVLPYIFPLIDTARLLGPAMVFAYAPDQYTTLFSHALIPEGLAPLLGNVEPLLVFAMPTLAVSRRMPSLLRFNLNQAFVLEVVLFAARAVAMGAAALVSLATGGADEMPMPTAMDVPVLLPGTEVIALFMAFCVLYSVAHTACGLLPDGIPALSEEAGKSLGTNGVAKHTKAVAGQGEGRESECTSQGDGPNSTM